MSRLKKFLLSALLILLSATSIIVVSDQISTGLSVLKGLSAQPTEIAIGSLIVGEKPWVDIRWYGAKGEGADESIKIQAAAIAAVNKTLLIPPGIWNTGITGITISGLTSIKMMPGSTITYTGAVAAITIDVSAGVMSGLYLDLYDIVSTGAYGIKVTSGGLDHSHLFLQGRIKAHNISGYTTAGIYVDTSFIQSEIDVLGFYNANPPRTAWGLYFVKGEATNLFESNQIKIGCIYSTQGLYADSAFGYNDISIDVDAGVVEGLTNKIDIAGVQNKIIVRSLNPLNIYYPAGFRLRSTAVGNAILISPNALHTITDDSPMGSNAIIAPVGLTNLIKNSSFETNSGAAILDWTISNLTSLNAEITDFKYGRQGVKLIPSAGNSYINQVLPNDVLGKTLTFMGWFKALATNTGSQALTLGDDTSTNDVGIPADGRWHYMGIRRTFAGGATNPYVRIWVSTAGPAGDTLYADGCVGVIGSIPTLPGNDRPIPLLFATGAGHTVDETIITLQSLGIIRQQ